MWARIRVGSGRSRWVRSLRAQLQCEIIQNHVAGLCRVDTVEYEDGKAFVVSSFVSEDAAEAGGSASLILKKMAVLNP